MYGEAELEINQETREKNYGETKLESGKEEVREENYVETREDIDIKRITRNRISSIGHHDRLK